MLYVKGASRTPEGVTVVEVGPVQPESLIQVTKPVGEFALTASSVFLFTENFAPSRLLEDGASESLLEEILGQPAETDPQTYTPDSRFLSSIQMPDGSLKQIVSFTEVTSEVGFASETLAA